MKRPLRFRPRRPDIAGMAWALALLVPCYFFISHPAVRGFGRFWMLVALVAWCSCTYGLVRQRQVAGWPERVALVVPIVLIPGVAIALLVAFPGIIRLLWDA